MVITSEVKQLVGCEQLSTGDKITGHLGSPVLPCHNVADCIPGLERSLRDEVARYLGLRVVGQLIRRIPRMLALG